MQNNKPSWSTAPDWANYLAMDDDTEFWYWFECEPHYENKKWRSPCKYKLAEVPNNTLEKRPK